MELLSPVGNFDNLIAAVQNGADAVYLGGSLFNARINAKNFSSEELKDAIMYSRKRGVDVHLTLNILMFNNELKKALEFAKFAYECGVSAIIVQDIGLAVELVKCFPDLPIHSSTQMTISNIYGVRQMEKMGLKRVVLSRELSIPEIKNIRKNTKMELECFGHGALCVSYSGQCLFSSMVGKRSGNRGLCAGPCRLNYNLLNDGKNIENGYLLSPKDICTLEILPELIDCGIDSLKIEGRKKSYEYVSIVTKIYRKYIDLAKDKTKKYKVDDEDIKQLLQIYNRGGLGTGYFKNRQNIIYPEKPNHLGLYVGKVAGINTKRKLVKLELSEPVSMGDVISINDGTSYVSEITKDNYFGEIKNIKDIKINDKVYKIVDNALNKKQWELYKKENRKVDILAELFEDDKNIYLELKNDKIQAKTALEKENYDVNELDNSRIASQIQKTGNTIFNIKSVQINVKELRLPISKLNNLRRETIEKLEKNLEASIRKTYDNEVNIRINYNDKKINKKPKINLYLQKFDKNINYSDFEYNEIYVQFKDLINQKSIRKCVVVLPTIIDDRYEKLIKNNLQVFDNVNAIMISHISQVEFLNSLNINKKIYADYTLNITNNLSQKILHELEIERFTVSHELDKNAINSFDNNVKKELVVYGRTCLMTSKFCPIGKNNNCGKVCKNGKYELEDRKNFIFPIEADCINCHTKIYNSKIISSDYKNIDIDYVRIDILDETESEIKNIIENTKNAKKFIGAKYTSGNGTLHCALT